tara:strand:+ start:4060 stop:4752 length:693 start_codon:yes stop_codon:yes gene_type:complete
MGKAKLINKIVKLFRLGDANRSHTTEGELLAAMTKARELMAKHNISMVEVEGRLDESKVNELRIKVSEHKAYTRKGKFARYDHPIMNAVATLTDTRVYMKSSGEYQSCMFVGDETDAHIAGELYGIMLSSLRKFTRQACGKGWSRYHTDYALGFGVRVSDRAKTEALKSKESSQSVALVVTKKNEALTKYMDTLGLVQAKTRDRRMSQEYNRGYQDGSKMNLSFDKNLKQ